jgi:hypothetical protein
MPEVGKNTQPVATRFYDKGGAVRSIMGSRDCVHKHIAEPDLVAGPEMANIGELAEIAPRSSRSEGGGRNVDRDPEFALENACVADMVPMIVGYDHGVNLADVPAVRGKPLLRLYACYPRVNQELDAAGFNINAISTAS